MTKKGNTLGKRFTFPRLFLLGLFLPFASCRYATTYFATYTVQTKANDKEISTHFINQLADKNKLTKDNQFNGVDTLGFYGEPYHYFKFWFEQRDTTTAIILDYSGVFGSRKNPPYRLLLQNITDSIRANFILINHDIKESNNAKMRSK